MKVWIIAAARSRAEKMGSARVPRADFGVAPKHSFFAQFIVQSVELYIIRVLSDDLLPLLVGG